MFMDVKIILNFIQLIYFCFKFKNSGSQCRKKYGKWKNDNLIILIPLRESDIN